MGHCGLSFEKPLFMFYFKNKYICFCDDTGVTKTEFRLIYC